MSLLLNPEQRMLADSAKAFLADRAPVSRLRQRRDRGEHALHDHALWADMAELGWTAAVLPEEHGGLGLGFQGLGALFEQLGRHLSVAPLLSSVVLGAGLLARLAPGPVQAEWLPLIAAGQRRLALALDESPRHAPQQVATIATRTADGAWQLNGRKAWVLDGPGADALLVLARTVPSGSESADTGVNGLSLFLVPVQHPGVSLQALCMIDSRPCAELRFTEVRLGHDCLLGAPGQAWPHVDAVLDQARACLAAELLGLATETFERTLAYLKQRVQFGVPIGSFQALQHRAARLHVALELTRSAVAAALEALDQSHPDVSEKVSLAKSKASDLGLLMCNEAVQLHGGIGVTDELDIGLFVKRARTLAQTFGDAVFHRERYAQLKGY